ncbi:DUF4139 domain-containing protein [Novosphingobium sp.]|uniref:DUF4139 domain-containing protein n=1 Tax=Novosphingobium sp. TaxID=1874826 RepID=UPI0035B46142
MRSPAPILAATLALLAAPALAQDVAASDPVDTSVTIYRAPWRNGGSISLDSLGGFAVVTETRRVTIPAGRSRLRFVGVVDGIVPESAIVTGLPGGVIEKNRDAALLSPATLLRASLGKQLLLKRTSATTGKVTFVPAEVTSANETGVMLRTKDGIEALRCSGVPEALRYEPGTGGLSARPTLSVQTRSARALTATVTLTYIAQGFDWSANYTAQVSADGKTMDLGGWITLANGNSVSLNNAQTQIVAGGLKRAYVRQFANAMPRALASCWPMQKTSDVPLKPDRPYELVQPFLGLAYDSFDAEMSSAELRKMNRMALPMMAMAAPPPPPPPAPPPPEAEQLGDLKLYRVAERTTVAARQMKQTRLIEQRGVPFERVYLAEFSARSWSDVTSEVMATPLLRTRNDKASQLGLPLPAGSFLVEQEQSGRAMLVGEPQLADTTVGEKIELRLGPAPDVTVTRTVLAASKDRALVPMLSSALFDRLSKGEQVQRIQIANAGAAPIQLEVKYYTAGAQRLVDADRPLDKVDGRYVFRIEVPANDKLVIHYAVTGI